MDSRVEDQIVSILLSRLGIAGIDFNVDEIFCHPAQNTEVLKNIAFEMP